MTRFLLAAFLVLCTIFSATAKGKNPNLSPDDYFTRHTKVMYWAKGDKAQPVFLASMEVWLQHFPIHECEVKVEPDRKSFNVIYYTCPAFQSSEPVMFKFTATPEYDFVILASITLSTKPLDTESYYLFVVNPFNSFGSYQSVITTPRQVFIVDREQQQTQVGSLQDFMLSHERKSYSCYAHLQNSPDLVVRCSYITKNGTDPAKLLTYRFKFTGKDTLLWVSTYTPAGELTGKSALRQISQIFDLPNFTYN